jgi:hypothetical protein
LVDVSEYDEGNYTLVVYSEDAALNTRLSSTWFVIDGTPPNITDRSPADGYVTGSNDIMLNWTVSDSVSDAVICNLSVNGMAYETGIEIISGSETAYQLDGLPWADYTWSVNCSDDARNANNSEEYMFTPSWVDSDSDGIHDLIDTVDGDENDIVQTGFSDLVLKINGSTNITSFNGVMDMMVYDIDEPVLGFDYNFSQSSINLSNITIIKGSGHILVNLHGQLQENYNKTIYINDNGFASLCAKDSEVDSIVEISAECDDIDETNLTSCIGNSSGITINGVTCIDSGEIIQISGLMYSGVKGTEPEPEVTEEPEEESSEPKATPDLSETFDCINGRLVITASHAGDMIKDLELLLVETGERENTDSDGQAEFTITEDGEYTIESDATDEYHPETFELNLELCKTEEPLGCVEDNECTEYETCLENECVAIQCECGFIMNRDCIDFECCEDSDCIDDEVCSSNVCIESAQPLPECISDADCDNGYVCHEQKCIENVVEPPIDTTGADAALAEAQDEIDNAKADGKDTSEAEVRLEQAQEAFEAGDYELAKELAEEATQLALNAEAAQDDNQIGSSNINLTEIERPENSLLGLIVVVTLAILVLSIAGYRYLSKK